MNPPPRPKMSDPAVRRRAVEDLMLDIIDWLGDEWKDAEREAYISDLMELDPNCDGYKAARELQTRHGWEPDAGLVEILDSDWGYKAEGDAIREWVEANRIGPKFSAGDVVRTPEGTGPIIGIYPSDATYVVQTDKFRALKRNHGVLGGYVIAFENCEVT